MLFFIKGSTHRRHHLPLLGASIAALIAGACGSDSGSTFDDGGKDAGLGVLDGSEPSNGGFLDDPDSGEGDAAPRELRIEPPELTITAAGSLAAVTGNGSFEAYLLGSAAPVAALWSVDDAGIGAIAGDGTFTTGRFAGKTRVRARVGNLEAHATVTVKFKITEDFTSLSDGDKTKLREGGSADTANFTWLYPYDGTVFPRGLLPPKLMFGGASPDAYYVRLKSNDLEYEGFYPGGGVRPRIVVDENWWQVITRSTGANDPVKVEVTKIAGGNVTGPIAETWGIAQGSLRGTVFYNTYNSQRVRASGASGAVMRLKPGEQVEVLLGRVGVPNGSGGTTTRDCTVCHSVSANGSTLVAGLGWGDGGNPYESGAFAISPTGQPSLRYALEEGRALPFGALTPDGKWLVSNASPHLRGLSGDLASRLYDATTGALVAEPYLGGDTARKLVTPSFSFDAKFLAFGDRSNQGQGRRLSILSADFTKDPPVLADNQELATSANRVLGWPAFTPDSKSVIYQEGSAYDTGGGRDGKAQLKHLCGDLQWVDVASKTKAPLDRLNGYEPDGAGGKKCYLPFCAVPDPDLPSPDGDGTNVCNTEDAHMNYEPTLLPVAVGGYYWVVFTSRRAYGNFISRGAGSVTAGGDIPFDNSSDGNGHIKGFRKKLWVAAIDINGTPGGDISHPAFLLEGQEVEAGNMRGFWALDPCKSNGSSCDSGDECCGGFCRQVTHADGGSGNVCIPPPSGCAQESEKCAVTADCCDAPTGALCLNGFCSIPTPPPPK